MITIKTPKISCLVVVDVLSNYNCIQSFMDQTYPNKELVVLSQVPSVFSQHKDDPNILLQIAPRNLTIEWSKDLAVELTTGEIICWWEPQEDPMWLTKRLQKDFDELFFPKLEFYKSGNMLYCGTDNSLNGEYWSKE